MTDHREFPAYDAGLLSDYGGGDVEWWHDYIRAELGRAHDFYESQIADHSEGRPDAPAVDEKALQRIRKQIVDLDYAAAPTKSEVFVLCGSFAAEFRDDLKALLAALGHTQPEQKRALPDVADPPWPPGEHNAKREGWKGFHKGRGRDECPFPPARTDLKRDYETGWDAARQALAKDAERDADKQAPTGRGE